MSNNKRERERKRRGIIPISKRIASFCTQPGYSPRKECYPYHSSTEIYGPLEEGRGTGSDSEQRGRHPQVDARGILTTLSAVTAITVAAVASVAAVGVVSTIPVGDTGLLDRGGCRLVRLEGVLRPGAGK